MVSSESIHKIGICGIGQMGAAAAVAFQRSGYEVLLWARNVDKLESVKETVANLNTWMDEHVGPKPKEGGQIRFETELACLDEEADLVMDCIAEDMDQKVELFLALEQCSKRGAVFITTTSGLSITELGRRSNCKNLLAGTHFWNPPHLMPLVEVIRSEDTPDDVMDCVCEIVEFRCESIAMYQASSAIVYCTRSGARRFIWCRKESPNPKISIRLHD